MLPGILVRLRARVWFCFAGWMNWYQPMKKEKAKKERWRRRRAVPLTPLFYLPGSRRIPNPNPNFLTLRVTLTLTLTHSDLGTCPILIILHMLHVTLPQCSVSFSNVFFILSIGRPRMHLLVHV